MFRAIHSVLRVPLRVSGRALLALGAGALAAQALAQAPATPPVGTSAPSSSAPGEAKPNDYADGATWLCRPGRQDACAIDLSTTIVAADGKLTPEKFSAAQDPKIDCFYVYPTVSLDPTPNSDMNAGPEEKSVIRAQFARFGSVCRTFAPLYRQVTLGSLRAGQAGQRVAVDRALAYNDVLAAWKHYLANDNQGRGVVLVGHSQGSGVLTQLIRNEIDGKPVQKQLISALLLGTNLAVPKGKDVGGAFQNVPLCRSATQLGCALSYVSFREEVPPPPSSRFGKVQGEGQVAACVNPAALTGGSATLHSYFGAAARPGSAPVSWATPEPKIETPFVSVPGLVSGECVSNEKGSYLSVKVNADPKDARTDRIAGDVERDGKVDADWGLHLIDVNLTMGNLLDLVKSQSQAYLTAAKSAS
jgi:hypothetical protein